MHVTHDKTLRRFTVTVDDRTAHLSYRLVGDAQIELRSTYVPPAIRRKGVGRMLVTHALAYAEHHRLDVIPTCWFVREVMDAGGPGGLPPPRDAADREATT